MVSPMLITQSASTIAQASDRDHDDGVKDLRLDAVVDAVPHKRGQRQACESVEAVEDETRHSAIMKGRSSRRSVNLGSGHGRTA